MASVNRLQVILSDSLAEQMKILASYERRSVSGMASVIIEDYLEQKIPEIGSSERYLRVMARIQSEKVREACHGIPEHKVEAIAEILEGDI